MKKFKLLMAVIAVITMLTTVAFAADESMDGYGLTVPESVELADGKVTFEVKLTKGFTVDAMAFQLHYNHDIWTVTADSTLTVTAKAAYDDFVCSSATTFTDGQVLATITATAKDAEKAVTAAGAFDIKEIWSEGSEDYLWCEGVYKTITVKAATPAHKDAEVAVAERTAEFTGASGQVYTNVWVGTYTVTFNDDAVTGIKLAFNGKEETVAVEGAGTAVVDVAIVGKAGNVNVSVVK